MTRPHFLRRPRTGRALALIGLLTLPVYGLVVAAWLTWGTP